MFCPNSHILVLWCYCPSVSNLHQSQHVETLPQKTRADLCHTRSQKVGVLKLRQTGWDRDQSTLNSPDRQTHWTQTCEKRNLRRAKNVQREIIHFSGRASLRAASMNSSVQKKKDMVDTDATPATWHKLASVNITASTLMANLFTPGPAALHSDGTALLRQVC